MVAILSSSPSQHSNAAMGNYAVYFTVENKLDVDLRLVNIRFNHGEVEENPNNGFIPAKTESGTFRFGGVGA